MFTTVDQVKALLGIEIDEFDPMIERAIAEATASIRNYTYQYISFVADELTLVMGSSSNSIFLPQLPVHDVTALFVSGHEVPETNYSVAYPLGIIRYHTRMIGAFEMVGVRYTHGFSEIPQDIQDIATRAAARAFQAGIRSTNMDGLSGVSATALGDYSVSFQSDQGGGVGEGPMGVSAARLLLRSEKDALNRYRIRRA